MSWWWWGGGIMWEKCLGSLINCYLATIYQNIIYCKPAVGKSGPRGKVQSLASTLIKHNYI